MNLRDRRAVAIGGATVALAVLSLRIAPWAWRAIGETRAELVARVELLERARAEVASTSALEDSGVVIRGRMEDLAAALLTGGTGQEAATDLESRLKVAAARHLVRINSTEPAADSADGGGLRRVVLRAGIESDTQGLLALLQAIALESAVLVVDDIRIAVADPRVPLSRPEVLHTDLTIYGWYFPAARSE
jgi:hypothetical protein